MKVHPGNTILCNDALRGKGLIRVSTETSKLLLDNKADVNAGNAQGETALHRAAYSGHANVVRLLTDLNTVRWQYVTT